jgi:CheY-like chemotaxis protein
MGATTRLILYAEDDLDHAELVLRGLAQSPSPATVVHLTDGEAAIDYLTLAVGDDPSVPLPNLVLLDLRLPKRDGIEVLQEIRANAQLDAVPVVILTTSEAERDLERAYHAHVNSYIVKPAEFELLTRVVQGLSTYWTTWNATPR